MDWSTPAIVSRFGVFLPQQPHPPLMSPEMTLRTHLYNQTQKPPGKVLLLTFRRGAVPPWKRLIQIYLPWREGARPPGAESAYTARPEPGYESPKLK